MTTLVAATRQADLMASLRRLDGRGTVGDVVADSGLPAEDVRAGLRSLLESHRGHLAVTDSGELVYEFEPGMIKRDTEPLLARLWSRARSILQGAFKVWIVVMLVVYFVVFVALVIAAVVASQRGNDSRGGFGGRGRGGSIGFDPLIWYWIWSPRWQLGRPYYGHRWERTLGRKDRVPFYKKVFAFVFGPDRPRPTRRQLDRSKLRLIRARSGVITTAELVEHTGTTVPEAEDDMGRLVGAYGGEPVVSPRGTLVYAFPDLVTSVKDRRARPPLPSWKRLEPELELTGNTPGANALVAGMNGFTLLASATAPWFIFPRLGLSGPAAVWGLIIIPVVFSVLFFTGPLVRMAGVASENRKRRKRNLRRIVTGFVYERAMRGESVSVAEAESFVRQRSTDARVGVGGDVAGVLDELAAAWDAEVTVADDGTTRWSFPGIRAEYAESAGVRDRLALDERPLGEIVYSTADTPDQAGARDLALFDAELDTGTADLSRVLPDVDGVGVEEPWELVAFDDELRATGRRD